MPLANIIVPAFPDVPRAPGIPPVLRQVGAATNNIVMLAADVATIVRMFAGPQWGIFKDGVPLLVGDSVVAFDFRREWRVSDYPIEGGEFRSYDKVRVPFDVRIMFAVSGQGSLLSSLIPGGAGWMAAPNRTAMLDLLDFYARSLDLLTVITPEAQYESCNIVHYDYRREARNGTTLIKVDVWLAEIRVAPSGQFTETKTEAGSAPVSDGAVQATPPPVTSTPAGASLITQQPLPLAPPAPTGAGTGLTIEPLPFGNFT